MPLSSNTTQKLGKLIPRLSSNHDGEVVATVRAMLRTLESGGADLHDVVAALDKPPVERVVYRDKVVYREAPQYAPKAEPAAHTPGSIYGFREVRSCADKLLDPDFCDLKESEGAFVQQMRDAADKYKGMFRMSPKQANWFRRLVDKHLGVDIKA